MNKNVTLKSVIAGFEKEYGKTHTDLNIHTYGSYIGVVTSYDNKTDVEFKLKHRDDHVTINKTQIFPSKVLVGNDGDIAKVHAARDTFMETMSLDEKNNLVIDLEPEFINKISEANKLAMENMKKDMTTWKEDLTTSENMMELVAGKKALENHEKLQEFLDKNNPVKKVVKPVEERTFNDNISEPDMTVEDELRKE